jgi:ribonuclease BN (tRNA processing enzyme)
LVLIHLNVEADRQAEELVAEAASAFEGDIALAHDEDVYEVSTSTEELRNRGRI